MVTQCLVTIIKCLDAEVLRNSSNDTQGKHGFV